MPKKSLGLGLVVGGGIIVALFLMFILTTPAADAQAMTPMWLGIIWGGLAMCWGFFRLIVGPSSLDHPHGGTDAGS